MSTLKSAAVWGVAALLFASSAARAEDTPNLDVALTKQGPALLEALKGKGHKTVGVLKFRVGSEGGKLRDNYGPINLSLADRLELSLLLAMKKGDDFNVIFRASEAVKETGNTRATHLTEKGRAAFFRFDPSPFNLPWNTDVKVQPDAFLTGEARLTPDLRFIDVVVQVFDRNSPQTLTELTRFRAVVDFRSLTEAGVSFVGARAPWSSQAPLTTQPASDSLKQETGNRPTIPNDKDAWQAEADKLLRALKDMPLKVDILYNDRPVKIETNPFGPPSESANALLRVREPDKDDVVTFRLRNDDPKETYGIVVQVNGRNTIFGEEAAPFECHKWILAPGQSVSIKGIQKDNDKYDAFKVKAEADSAADKMNYGSNPGTFTLTVFRGATSEKDLELVKADKELSQKNTDVAAISKGTGALVGKITASDPVAFRSNLEALTKKDVDNSESKGKGYVSTEGVGKMKVKDVVFRSIQAPVISATIRYFDPKEK